jgi:CRISPR/Cas system CMR subunit Cmr4 (Cas7 group RAMP superfamily)
VPFCAGSAIEGALREFARESPKEKWRREALAKIGATPGSMRVQVGRSETSRDVFIDEEVCGRESLDVLERSALVERGGL